MNPVVSRRRILTVLAQIAIPESWPTQELHLRYARNMRHDPTSGTFHPRTTSLFFIKS